MLHQLSKKFGKVLMDKITITVIVLLWLAMLTRPAHCQKFAIIGDFGVNTDTVRQVVRLIDSIGVDYILTTGDNFHVWGGHPDSSIKKFLSGYMPGRLFTVPGNHDVTDPTQGYFTQGTYLQTYKEYMYWLPENRRYYTKTFGDVTFVFMNSDFGGNYSYCPGKNKVWEPSGIDSNSIQGGYVKNVLRTSQSLYKGVILHYPPFYNYPQGISTATVMCDGVPYTFSLKNDTLIQRLRWNYAGWGANIVFSGHTHNYERHYQDSINYVITSLGGAKQGTWDTTGVMRPGTKYHYKGGFGATFVTVGKDSMLVETILINRDTIDRFAVYPDKSIRLKTLVQGFTNDEMETISDTVKVLFRLPQAPYGAVDTSVARFNHQGYSIHRLKDVSASDSFYVQIKHRNGLSQWSSRPIRLGKGLIDFDATNVENILGMTGIMKNGKLLMYSGDVDQDGTIDITDYGLVDSAALRFDEGYIPTDLNGSNFVDGADLDIVDLNVLQFPITATP